MTGKPTSLEDWQQIARFNLETALMGEQRNLVMAELLGRALNHLEKTLNSEVVKNAQFVSYSEAISGAGEFLKETKARQGTMNTSVSEVQLIIKKAEALDQIATGILPNGDHVEGQTYEYANLAKEGKT